MKLLKPFKKLPKGYYRLIIVGWVVLPLFFAIIVTAAADTPDEGERWLTAALILGFPIYYILARFGVWIYDGFREQEEQ